MNIGIMVTQFGKEQYIISQKGRDIFQSYSHPVAIRRWNSRVLIIDPARIQGRTKIYLKEFIGEVVYNDIVDRADLQVTIETGGWKVRFRTLT